MDVLVWGLAAFGLLCFAVAGLMFLMHVRFGRSNSRDAQANLQTMFFLLKVGLVCHVAAFVASLLIQ